MGKVIDIEIDSVVQTLNMEEVPGQGINMVFSDPELVVKMDKEILREKK